MIMKKRFAAMMLALSLMLGAAAGAQAEIIPAHGQGQIGLEAVVLCEKLTIRQEPRSNAAAGKTLKYGDWLIVLEQQDGWAKCILSDSIDEEPAGWVNAAYLAIDPAWFRTEALTPVYAWNSTAAPRVGLLDTNKTLPILKIEGAWLLVSLRGAVGWIRP